MRRRAKHPTNTIWITLMLRNVHIQSICASLDLLQLELHVRVSKTIGHPLRSFMITRRLQDGPQVNLAWKPEGFCILARESPCVGFRILGSQYPARQCIWEHEPVKSYACCIRNLANPNSKPNLRNFFLFSLKARRSKTFAT